MAEKIRKGRGFARMGQNLNGNTGTELEYGSDTFSGPLNEETAKAQLSDNAFLQSIYSFYGERDGKTFQTKDEAISYYLEDRRWRNLNTGGIAKDWAQTSGMSDTQSKRLAKLQQVYDALPFAADGNVGDAILDGGAAMLTDPLNVVGFGLGGMAAKGAIATAKTGLSRSALKGVGLKAAAKSGAKGEAVASFIAEGVADIGIQNRNIEIGLQDEVSYGQALGTATVGGLTGGVMGAGMGLLGSVSPKITGKKGLFGEEGGSLKDRLTNNPIRQGLEARRDRFIAERAARTPLGVGEADAVDTPQSALEALRDQYKEERQNLIDEQVGEQDPSAVAGEGRNADPVNPVDTRPLDEKISNIEWVMKWPERKAVIEAEIDKLNKQSAEGEFDPEVNRLLEEKQRQLQTGDSLFDQVVTLAERKLANGDMDVNEALDDVIDELGPDIAGLLEYNPLRDGEVAPQDTPPIQGEGFEINQAPQADTQTIVPEGTPVPEGVNARPVQDPRSQQFDQNATDTESDTQVVSPNDPRTAEPEVSPQDRIAQIDERLSRRKGSIEKDISALRRQMKEKQAAGQSAETERQQIADLQDERRSLKEERNTLQNLIDQEEAAKVEQVAQADQTVDAEAKIDADEEEVFDPEEAFMDYDEAPADVEVNPYVKAEAEIRTAVGANESPTPARIRSAMKDLDFTDEEIDALVATLPKGRSKKAIAGRQAVMDSVIEDAMARSEVDRLIDTLLSPSEGKFSRSDVVFNSQIMDALIKSELPPNLQPYASVYLERLQKDMAQARVAEAFFMFDGNASQAEIREVLAGDIGNENFLNVVDEILNGDDFDFVQNAPRTKANVKVSEVEKHMNRVLDSLEKQYPGSTKAYNAYKAAVLRAMVKNSGKSADEIKKMIDKQQDALLDRFLQSDDFAKKVASTGNYRTMRDVSVSEKDGDYATYQGRTIHRGFREIDEDGNESMYKVGRVQSILRSTKNKDYHGKDMDRIRVREEGEARSFKYSAAASSRHAIEQASIDSKSMNRKVVDPLKRERSIEAYEEAKAKGEDVPGNDPRQLEAAIKRIKKDEKRIKDLQKKKDEADPNDRELIAKLDKDITEAKLVQESIFSPSEGVVDMVSFTDYDANRIQNDVGYLKDLLRRRLEALVKSTDQEATANRIEKARSTALRRYGVVSDKIASVNRDIAVAIRKGQADKIPALRGELDALNKEAKNLAKMADEEELVARQKRVEHLKTMLETGKGENGKKLTEQQRDFIASRIPELEKEVKAMRRGAGLEPMNVEKRLLREAQKALSAEYRAQWRAKQEGQTIPTMPDTIAEIEAAYGVQLSEADIDEANMLARRSEYEAWVMGTEANRLEVLNAESAGMPPERVAEQAQAIHAETQQKLAQTTPPSTKPRGVANPPRLVVVKNKQFDMRNDVDYKKADNGETHAYIDGKMVSRIKRIADEAGAIFKVTHLDGQVRFTESEDDVFRILADLNFDVLAKRADGLNRPDAEVDAAIPTDVPDWHNATMYDGADDVAVPSESIRSFEEAPTELRPKEEMVTAEDIVVPEGNLVAIQIIDPQSQFFGTNRGVRVLNEGQTLASAAGELLPHQYVVGSVVGVNPNTGGRTNSGTVAAAKTFRALHADDKQVPFGKKTLTEARNLGVVETAPQLGESPRARKNRAVNEQSLKDIQIPEGRVPQALRGSKPPKTAAELNDKVLAMENTKWSAFKTPQQFAQFTKALEEGYALLDELTGGTGVKFTNQKRTQSYRELKKVIAGKDSREIAEILTVFNHIANGRELNGAPDQSMPRFGESNDETYGYRLQNSASGTQGNRITIGSTDKSVPDTLNFSHEMGHWAYMNILTPSERVEFWKIAGKYMSDDGVNVESLKRRLPGIDGDAELRSPAEFFANQFAMYTATRRDGATANLFQRVAKKVVSIVNRMLGLKEETLDPDLIPLFDRILPDSPLDVDGNLAKGLKNQFEEVAARADALSGTGSKSVRLIAQQLRDLRDLQIQIEKELLLGAKTDGMNGMALSEMLDEIGRRIYGMYGGRPGEKTHRSGMKRVGLLDSYTYNRKTRRMEPAYDPDSVEFTADGKTYRKFKYHNARAVRGDLLSVSRRIQEALAHYKLHGKASTLDDVPTQGRGGQRTAEQEAELAALIRDQEADMQADSTGTSDMLDLNYERAVEMNEAGGMGSTYDATLELLNYEVAAKTSNEDAMTDMLMLSNDAINALDRAIEELTGAFNRAMPKGMDRIPAVTKSGKIYEIGANKHTKKARGRHFKNQEVFAKAFFDALETADKEVFGNLNTADPMPSGESFELMDNIELLRLLKENKGTEYAKAIKAHLKTRVQREPAKISSTTYANFDKETKEAFNNLYKSGTTKEDAQSVFVDAMESGNYDLANVAVSRIFELGGSNEPSARLVRRAIQSEIADTSAPSRENGIPEHAPSAIKEALSKITHRNKRVEHNARTMLYRMLNMLGRTEKGNVEDTMFMSVEDLYRLSGAPMPEGAEGAFNLVANFKNDAFNKLRGDMRKYAIGLQEGKGDPVSAMHEIGHMIVRSTFSNEDKDFIMSAFKEAVQKGDKVATEFLDLYRKQGMDGDARLAEEWFVESWGGWMTERVAKGDMWKLRGPSGDVAELTIRGRLSSLADRLYQMVAYVVNGMMGRKTVHQKFRQMTYFGDMFGGARKKRQVSNMIGNTTAPAVNPRLAPAYVKDVIKNLSREKQLRVREFLGIGPDEDLAKYVIYHGTPNGDAFNRITHPDAFIHPSDDTAVFGPGVYTTKNPDYAQFYAEGNGKRRAFAEKMPEGPKKDRVFDLLDARDNAENALEDLYLEFMSGSVTRNRVQDMQLRLDSIDQELARLMDFGNSPRVIPMFARLDNLLDLSADRSFSFGTGDQNDVMPLIMALKQRGYSTDESFSKLLEELTMVTDNPDLPLDGNYVHTLLQRAVGDDYATLNKFLSEEGYEGIVGGQRMADGTDNREFVFFKPNSMKHIKATEFDVDKDGLYARLIGEDESTGLASRALETIALNEKPLDIDDMIDISEDLQRSAASRLRNPIKRMLRKELPTTEDIDTVKQTSSIFTYFKENSQRLRSMGSNWLADIIKPENGTGIYERHDIDLSDKVMPALNALRALPDNKNFVGRWMRRNVPIFNKMTFGAVKNKYAHPESQDRILGAIRRGEMAVRKLKPEEQRVARTIIQQFEKERQALLDAGLPVGDARRGPGQFYVPQQWDTEIIRENPKEAYEAFARFFYQESRRPDYEYPVLDKATAYQKSKDLIDAMIDATGETYGDDVLRRAVGDPFYNRVLNLQPGQYDFMERFLVNDLEGLLVQYFDRTTRKIAIAQRFGAGGHGYNSYITTVERGVDGAVQTLMANKTIRYKNRQYQSEAMIEEQIIPPMKGSTEDIKSLVETVQGIMKSTSGDIRGRKQHAMNLILSKYDPMDQADPNVKIRAESIVNAFKDFPDPIAGSSHAAKLVKFSDDMVDVLNKRPLRKYSENEISYKISRSVKAFNSITLLSFTTLTSLGDAVLPLVRSGNMGAFLKAQAKYYTNPEYRAAAKNIGTGIENLVHDRMVQMAGEGSQKVQNAFFNMTLLTPWTNMQREIAGLVGFEAFKSEILKARRLASAGNTSSYSYKTAERFLKRYGLTGENAAVDFLNPDVDMPLDLRDTSVMNNKQLRYAILRFTNEAIYTPNPNDIPLWAQTPWGSMFFQLKSFQLMMARMGGYIIKEAKQGNIAPALYMATAGVGMGYASAAIKDFAQARGGEDNEERALRKRSANEIIPLVATALNIPEDSVTDEVVGSYFEGLLAIGGLGLFAELMYNTAQQADNGKYGFVRTAGAFFGPSVSVIEDVYDVGIAGPAGLFDEDKNARKREAVRSVFGRIPVVGQQRGLREDVVDSIAGEAKTGGRKKKTNTGTKNAFGGSDAFGGSNAFDGKD